MPLAGARLDDVGRPDAVVDYGEVPESLHRRDVVRAVRFEAAPNEFLLRVDRVARYLVTNGNRILIDVHPSSDPRDVTLFLLGSVLAALLLQRRLLVLHGSVICDRERGIAFLGPSGAGKSTLAVALSKCGFSLLSDDLCVIRFVEGVPTVLPGFHTAKLWPDALNRLGIPAEDLPRLRPMLEKRALSLEHVGTEPIELKELFVLRTSRTADAVFEPLSALGLFPSLRALTFRPRFIRPFGLEAWHFSQNLALCHHVLATLLTRPEDQAPDALAARVAARIRR